MRYREQQHYITGSRIWGGLAAALLIASAAASVRLSLHTRRVILFEFLLAVAALVASVYYTPDYLHLTVMLEKTVRWEFKIRWRIIAGALVLGIVAITSRSDLVALMVSISWLLAVNYMAPKYAIGRPALYYSVRDLALVAVLLFVGKLDLMMATAIVAASVHLSVVIARRFPVSWGIFNSSIGCFVLVGGFWRATYEHKFLIAACSLVVASALGTALLVWRAQRHNAGNINAAVGELEDFTGYSRERIRQLWATSNQELAKNWNAAALPEDDPEPLAEWYRDNSELYLFAISGYNLEYKRIRSNLKVLRFARGSCLDYGAGNGEIVLELARRGQPASYYDVDGVTMKFAKQRAGNQGLNVQFFSAKSDLSRATSTSPFDTVFSFDVLEHLPDLPGELNFLASLLGPGGLLVFDVPAGSTKAHPMHLNHDLNVGEFFLSRGFKDERNFWQRLPFRKEEKYFFRAPMAESRNRENRAAEVTPRRES